MKTKNPVRIVTLASLFDGHDVSINIMRRILQSQGAEVIHLGHNRSVQEAVQTALQEGVQGLAVSSYQGGHMEYFKYMRDLLDQNGAPYVKIYGGGGGVIMYNEKEELESYGISQIFHPDDGRKLGLEGMIQEIVKGCDFDINEVGKESKNREHLLGLALSAIENDKKADHWTSLCLKKFAGKKDTPVLGITGTGGAGKSSLIDELVHRFLNHYKDFKVAVVCVDPSKSKTGGALLGDRIRMNSLTREGVFMRSLASRQSGNEISDSLSPVLEFLKQLDFDLIIAESSGIGQGSMAITKVSDYSMYVMTSEFGAQTQLEKIEMIDFADFIVINKSDRRGSEDAFRDVKKQYARSRKLFHQTDGFPVYLTQASHFNDVGLNELFVGIADKFSEKDSFWKTKPQFINSKKEGMIPAERQNYLADCVQVVQNYKKRTKELSEKASLFQSLEESLPYTKDKDSLKEKQTEIRKHFKKEEWELLQNYENFQKDYSQEELSYEVRGKVIKQPLTEMSLSHLQIPRVSFPQYKDWGERFSFMSLENVPGYFPYTAGVFPLKRKEELPSRQFAGEGGPKKTNQRFHYLTENEPAKRLSTAFDSVTLYGEDPHLRPDIYGKVGESGVNISTLDDMKDLYSGFDLCDPSTSVSMTINGPAPMALAFFLNTAIAQQVEKKEKELKRKLKESEWQEVKDYTLQTVRGTIQADILKEDQGQNTCIFSIDFALKLMGDIQEYFINHKVKNFYSVSISGYHIAEAGANPITQLALTLSNALTYVEYYLNRGMKIDDFAPSLSFFFSNGLDPEYTVIGRVARRLWAIIMKEKYKANAKSQKLKYHVQTSGRSLHAQEMTFNDIRTTLQALLALSDHCNSLHTNAYDEAVTTPTESSVRQAQAIQLIINKEYGYAKSENPLQGSYFIDHLTEQVEEAVLEEFLKINERDGVLGAMERQYQRSRIQEESLYYEELKHNGEYPIVGVNCFLDPKKSGQSVNENIELARATKAEKEEQLKRNENFKKENKDEAKVQIEKLKAQCLANKNIFEALMEASRYCTLGEMTNALYEVGGQYRRNL